MVKCEKCNKAKCQCERNELINELTLQLQAKVQNELQNDLIKRRITQIYKELKLPV